MMSIPTDTQPATPKNIIICSDGTGNTANKNRGTNVFKLYELLDLQPQARQVAVYHDGVGTEKLKLIRGIAGAFGIGLSRQVKQLYAELARVYRPEDRIFLFGFSRGAFTVRTLAGLIDACGIIETEHKDITTDQDLNTLAKKAYKAYRRRYQTVPQLVWRGVVNWVTGSWDKDPAAEFKTNFGVEIAGGNGKSKDIPIRFIGVWDTVDAVGFPIAGVAALFNTFLYRFKFSDYHLLPNVKRACHAVAIDDERLTFHPELWMETHRSQDEATPRKGRWDQMVSLMKSLLGRRKRHRAPEAPDDRIEQVWFSGVHSNVGGGYPKQGVSLIVLHWMMERAAAQGLRFLPNDIVDRKNVNDKLYDSRAGLAVYYRYKPRDLTEACRVCDGTRPKIHVSVFERIAQGIEGYAPNLPTEFELVLDDGRDAATLESDITQVMQSSLDKNGSPLGRVTGCIALREWTHFAFFSLTILFVALPVLVQIEAIQQRLPGVVWTSANLLAIEFVDRSGWGGALLTGALLFVLLGLAYAAGLLARTRLERALSEYWLPRRKSLREILERRNV